MRLLSLALLAITSSVAYAADPWIVLEGTPDLPGNGKHIVLVSGDEEYRSEETLPALAKILAKHHGYKCTVLFAIDPKTGEIDPNKNDNIPGLESLKTADLMVLFTRFRNLPDDQMKHIIDYTEAGKPVIGLRTATHAFNLKKTSSYIQYTWNNREADYAGGYGKQVLGETWVAHHGAHGKQGTRGIFVEEHKNHPILQGIEAGSIFGTTDVYTVKLPLAEGCTPLVMGEVTETLKPDSKAIDGPKNNPMMPVSWTKNYTGKSGKVGRVFTTTMGASEDFAYEGTRRMLVNSCYWALGMEAKMPEKAKVDIVGTFEPSPFKNNGFKKGLKPTDLLKD